MDRAYLDTSWLIKINFEDPERVHEKSLHRYKALFSAEILIAELYSYLQRENLKRELIGVQFQAITFIIPDRSIQKEIDSVLLSGYTRGADLWHLACACYLSPKTKNLDFLTADERQREIAARLGFRIPRSKGTTK